MPNPRKSPEHKRKREIKIALTEAEYQQVIEAAKTAGYPPSVLARLVLLGTPFKASASINPEAWAQVGIHMDHLQQISTLLRQLQYDATRSLDRTIALPAQIPPLFEQELSELRRAYLALIRRSTPIPEEPT